MKNQIHLYALVLVTMFGGVSAAFAQEGDEYAECTQLLNSPPLDTLLTQNEGHDFGQLTSRRQGAALLGVKCSRDQIVEYFQSAGWEFIGESHIYGESGPSHNLYIRDNSLAFCRLRELPWRLILTRCGASSGFYLFEGRVTHIGASGVK